MLRTLQNAWRSPLLPNGIREALRPLANQTIFALSGLRASKVADQGPILVSGFMNEVLGIGRAGRLTADALEAAGFEVVRHDIRPLLNGGHFASENLPTPPSGVWILHCNPEEAAVVLARLPRSVRNGRYAIGYWVYELPKAPRWWRSFAANFHEVWTPSAFSALAIETERTPLKVMPHPGPAVRRKAATAAGALRVLSLCDLRSSAARKNPLGAVSIFLKAFPEASERASLTLKVVQARYDDAAMQDIERRIAGRNDVTLLTAELCDLETLALFATHDVLLSPHRAEGFGLPLLEAMAHGCLPLATGWSGNLDFMREIPETLIAYSLVAVADPRGVYRDTAQQWAEPDLEAAAKMLAQWQSRPGDMELLRDRGYRAVQAINERWSAEALRSGEFAAWAKTRDGSSYSAATG